MHQILIRPLITEKMSDLTADQSKYGFLVNPRANKIEVKRAVEEKFNAV
jgi:large subunit ribosomal protein L23